MSNPSIEELKRLVAKLNDVVSRYDDSHGAEGALSRAEIRAASRDITNAMTDDLEKSWEHCLHMTELIALRSFVGLGVFQKIPLEGSISKVELAKAVNADESLIVGTGMLDQTRPDGGDYKHTRFSRSYADPTLGPAGIFYHAMYEVYLKSTVLLDDFIKEKHQAQPTLPYALPSSNTSNPVVWSRKRDGQSTWDVMASEPATMSLFQSALKFMNGMIPPAGPYIDFSKFAATSADDEQDRKQIVDVGGGIGLVLADILKATPALDPHKCILQDVGGVIDIATPAKELGVETMVIDFNKEQPVRGAKAYYTRFITHDYTDPEAINILTHIAGSMAPDSTLLVADAMIPDRVSEATLSAATLDGIMWCIGGKERTERGFQTILGAAGLEIVRVNKVPASPGVVIEAQLRKTD